MIFRFEIRHIATRIETCCETTIGDFSCILRAFWRGGGKVGKPCHSLPPPRFPPRPCSQRTRFLSFPLHRFFATHFVQHRRQPSPATTRLSFLEMTAVCQRVDGSNIRREHVARDGHYSSMLHHAVETSAVAGQASLSCCNSCPLDSCGRPNPNSNRHAHKPSSRQRQRLLAIVSAATD